MRYTILIYIVSAVTCLPQKPEISPDLLHKAQDVFGIKNTTTTTESTTLIDKGNFLQPTKSKDDASCKRSDGKDGVCVPYYQCSVETQTVITDGSTLLDIRSGSCKHYLEWCCQLDNANDTRPTVTPIPGREEDMPCGYSNIGALEQVRIVSDEQTAEFAEYPWMVALLKKTEPGSKWSKGDYIGGGSIIHPKVVLTGAHKLDGKEPNEVKCRAGEWDTQTELEVFPHQERDAQKFIIHEEFFRPSIINNIGLIILERPFEISSSNTPHIGVACVGNAVPMPGTKCETMGWGLENFNNIEKYAVILRKVSLKLTSRNRCLNALRGTRLGSRFQLHQSLMCAGGEAGQDACSGDGGSPLVCPIGNNSDRYAIVGTVAWGIGCGDAGVPGVYSNIPDFKSWINTKVKEEGLQIKTYDYAD